MTALLEYLHDRQEASYLVTELATQIITEEADVTTKLQYIDRLVKRAVKPMMAEDAERLRTLLLDPDTAKYFRDPLKAIQDGSYIQLARDQHGYELERRGVICLGEQRNICSFVP